MIYRVRYTSTPTYLLVQVLKRKDQPERYKDAYGIRIVKDGVLELDWFSDPERWAEEWREATIEEWALAVMKGKYV